ncbi:MAG: hypothetical protein HWD92_03590 [Flavobacteriia bacterium]|nr:hypothetical protein [Flavobacteriia bacterium]
MKHFSLFAFALLLSCTSTPEESTTEDAAIVIVPADSTKEERPLAELAPEQQSAFDALNVLQTSSDEPNRLFSTFANQEQVCYPPDTIITISQEEFRAAMQDFVNQNYSQLSREERDDLAMKSALAADLYAVSLCLNNSTDVSFVEGAPRKGVWVLRNLLRRRDVIMVW